MQDRELNRQILGIEAPWFVRRVELKLAEGEGHVYLERGAHSGHGQLANVDTSTAPEVMLYFPKEGEL